MAVGDNEDFHLSCAPRSVISKRCREADAPGIPQTFTRKLMARPGRVVAATETGASIG
jgi:hypothetical protein